jgi:hypothetical protein
MRTDPARRRGSPRFERLESRLALSVPDGATGLLDISDAPPDRPVAEMSIAPGPPAGVLVAALVEPAPGSVLTAAPGALVLSFNRPINRATLGSVLFLAALDADSEWEALDAGVLDLSGMVLSVPLGRALGPGPYQVLAAPGSDLADLDGNPLVADGQPLVVGGFEVAAARAVTLEAAADLGSLVGGRVVAVAGDLDFEANPHAVALYKVTLPAGAFWRLGLEVAAERDGGTLDSALALLDGLGRPIATAEFGRSDFPDDPYLFAGLDPGDYYLGVSGTGDLPDRPDGYDPASGSAGTDPQAQAGGAFTLRVVADPIDGPIRVLDFAVDRADPRDPRPTGFTLGFSGAVRIDTANDQQNQGLDAAVEVIDQDGYPWPITASRYDESEARISYLFRRSLPGGRYTVLLPEGGGLVDLAGLAPVAPGLPRGVLGTFTVVARGPGEDPYDLGALLLDDALDGIPVAGELSPGQSIDVRLVVTQPGLYKLQGGHTGAGLAISRIGSDGTIALDPGEPEGLGGPNLAFLRPAEYVLRYRATGPGPVAFQFKLWLTLTPERIVFNGVGQGPALSLRLIAPSAPSPLLGVVPSAPSPLLGVVLPPSDPPPAPGAPPTAPGLPPTAVPPPIPIDPPPAVPPPIPIDPPPAAIPPPISIDPSSAAPPQGLPAGTSAGAGGSPALPTSTGTPEVVNPGLILGLRSDFVGRPTPDGRLAASIIAAAVPSGPAGVPGLNRIAQDMRLGSGLGRRSSSRARPGGVRERPAGPVAAVASEAAPATAGEPEGPSGDTATEGVALGSGEPSDASWLERSAAVVGRWLERGPQDVPSVAEGPGPSPTAPGRVEYAAAGLGPHADGGIDSIVFVCVGLVSVLAVRSRRRIDLTLMRLRARRLPRRLGWQPIGRPGLPPPADGTFRDAQDMSSRSPDRRGDR